MLNSFVIRRNKPFLCYVESREEYYLHLGHLEPGIYLCSNIFNFLKKCSVFCTVLKASYPR